MPLRLLGPALRLASPCGEGVLDLAPLSLPTPPLPSALRLAVVRSPHRCHLRLAPCRQPLLANAAARTRNRITEPLTQPTAPSRIFFHSYDSAEGVAPRANRATKAAALEAQYFDAETVRRNHAGGGGGRGQFKQSAAGLGRRGSTYAGFGADDDQGEGASSSV